ncbi:MAG: enoyl-CoA hydratase/isomerase family protein [bacterium]|nr:enoyl-CoA hydratase/isomerase family protein [bacterium]
MSDHIVYSKEGALASLRFNRPEKKNAITMAMYAALAAGLRDAQDDPDVRALGIFGGEAFTAGNDIAGFIAAASLGGAIEDLPVVAFLRGLAAFPKPVIAGVKGVAIGIGTTLLMHCDAVVAGESARFAMPFTKLALVPEGASSVLFPLIAGRMRASWYILSGEQFDAVTARELGLVTKVCADADVDGAVAMMCGALAELPPKALAASKRLLKAPFAQLVDAAFAAEFEAFGTALRSSEAAEAFMKFMQR